MNRQSSAVSQVASASNHYGIALSLRRRQRLASSQILSADWLLKRSEDGIAAARVKGKLPGRRPLDPDKAIAALSSVSAGMSPTDAAGNLAQVARRFIARWRSAAFAAPGHVIVYGPTVGIKRY